MRRVLQIIDSISEETAKVTRWACLVLVFVLSVEVFMRYILDRPTLWSYELSTMLGLTIMVTGLAHAHRYGAHIRIDIVYKLFSTRGKAMIDTIGTIFFLSPVVVAFACFSAYWAWHSWSVGEVLTESYWYPPAWPIRVVMFFGFFLFGLQGIAELIRHLISLKEK